MSSNLSPIGKSTQTSNISSSVIPAGTLLFTCKPFVYTLSDKLIDTHCDNCLKSAASSSCENGSGINIEFLRRESNTRLFRCAGCQLLRYCGKECQKAAWDAGHKLECKPMRLLRKVPPSFVRLILRILIKLNAKVDYYDKISDKHYRRFRDLMSHFNDVKQDPVRIEHIFTVRKVLESILRHQKAITLPNESELAGICGRVYVNTFRITNSELAPLGTGLYLGASIFDHSCEPMAVATFESMNIYIRNIADIPASFPIEKVTISYQDTIRPTDLRIQGLKNIYYFTCQCERCSSRKYDLPMNAIKCPNNDCRTEVNLAMENCPSCACMLTEPFICQIQEIEELVQTKLEEMHDTAYLDACEMCLNLMNRANFSETHWLQTSVSSTAFDACIDFQSWEKAWEYGKLALLGYRKYLSKCHPFLGIVLLKMAKLAWFLHKEDDARNFIVEAKSILDLTHGECSSIHATELMPLHKEIAEPAVA